MHCAAGQRKAQYELYRKYCDAMYSVCCRLMGENVAAVEVMQDAFLTVYDKIATYNFQSTLGAWIKRIVINKCIDYLRLKKKYFLELSEEVNAVADEIPEQRNINVDLIKKAIEVLPGGYKMVFTLYALEGYDHEEIAQILNISEQTSKSQYHRAKLKLKEELIKMGGLSAIYK